MKTWIKKKMIAFRCLAKELPATVRVSLLLWCDGLLMLHRRITESFFKPEA